MFYLEGTTKFNSVCILYNFHFKVSGMKEFNQDRAMIRIAATYRIQCSTFVFTSTLLRFRTLGTMCK